MKIKINNYELNTNEILSIYPPSKYIGDQERLGCDVVNQYNTTYSGFTYHTSVKYLWAKVYSSKAKYYIIYDDPDEDRKIQNIVSYAFKQGITVFFRTRSNCTAGLTPVYSELVKQTNIYHSRPGNQYDYMGSYYTEAPENKDFPIIKDITKNKLKKFITYYDITYPETEYDWYLAARQIKFYLKNKIPTAYDKNLYYRCRECGELVRRGTASEHICYCDVAPKRLHIEYLLNGDDE